MRFEPILRGREAVVEAGDAPVGAGAGLLDAAAAAGDAADEQMPAPASAGIGRGGTRRGRRSDGEFGGEGFCGGAEEEPDLEADRWANRQEW